MENAINIQERLHHRQARILDQHLYSQSAVLLPLVEENGKLSVLFEVRAHHLKRQPGEICFPGGRVEKEDTDEKLTAVRETCEELGLQEEHIDVWGPLDVLVAFFPVMISPYVGKLSSVKEICPNPDEVAEVFTVPLDFLLKTEPLRYDIPLKMNPPDDFPFELIPNGIDYKWRQSYVPEYFYQYDGKVIWGLTARILRHFIQLIS